MRSCFKSLLCFVLITFAGMFAMADTYVPQGVANEVVMCDDYYYIFSSESTEFVDFYTEDFNHLLRYVKVGSEGWDEGKWYTENGEATNPVTYVKPNYEPPVDESAQVGWFGCLFDCVSIDNDKMVFVSLQVTDSQFEYYLNTVGNYQAGHWYRRFYGPPSSVIEAFGIESDAIPPADNTNWLTYGYHDYSWCDLYDGLYWFESGEATEGQPFPKYFVYDSNNDRWYTGMGMPVMTGIVVHTFN